LNVVSPLPPLHSAIGHHTVAVAAALQELADVTLWTPQDAQTEPADTGLDLPVVHYDPARMDWARMNRADATIYNLGNNATFHRGIFDIARQCPGIVVLHDTRLQHFFARYSEHEGAGRAFYLECMRRCHGPGAVADAGRWLARQQSLDTLVERYPLTIAAVDGALAAVLHNAEEHRNLSLQTRTPVFYQPLAFPAGPLPQRAAPDGTLRLVVFGFLGPNRRLAQTIDAIAALPDQTVQLDIFGLMDEPRPVEAQIAALGLWGRVRCRGFVPEAELQAALADADLAINLRYPAMGEASMSQLRIWDAALPSVVTRTGWYATLPDDAVFFVEPEHEAETLRAHLEMLRSDPGRFRRAGLRGRTLLEQQHTPARYAEGLLGIVAQCARLHARRNAIALSRRAVDALLDAAGLGGIALCAEDVAAAVSSLA
jgi:glycosyltransferase involved in cell wall biosynthesis